MPRKRKQTKNLAFTFDPASPPSAEGQALLDALRSNLSLLGEIAARYEVNNKPERPEDPPSIGTPGDIHSLLIHVNHFVRCVNYSGRSDSLFT